MNRAALKRVRDRLRDLPPGVQFNQTDAILSVREGCLHACTAGVAVIELVYGGDIEKTKRAVSRGSDNTETDAWPGRVLRAAAKKLGYPGGHCWKGGPHKLFMTKPRGTAPDAAADAIQRILDGTLDHVTGDAWKRGGEK